MNHIEDIFGKEPIELVIKFYTSTIKAFNNGQMSLSFESVKELLEDKIHDCYFRNLEGENQKVIIPLEVNGYQVEFFIVWHKTTFSYKISTKNKFKPVLKDFIRLPESGFIQEQCRIKIIDIKEAYRTRDELEQLYERILTLDIPAEIDIEKENEIWYKYIDATKKIIDKRQQPFQVRRWHGIKSIGGNKEKATRFSFKVDLKVEENKEHKAIEEKLKELDVESPRFDSEGSILLTLDDIFKALDPVLDKEFQGIVVREETIGCIVKLRPLSISQQVRMDLENLNWNLKTYGDFNKKQVFFSNIQNNSKQIKLPGEIINKYGLKRIGFYARFKLTNKDKEHSFREIEEKVEAKLYGHWFEDSKKLFFERIVQQRKRFYDEGYFGVSKPDICEAYTYPANMEQPFPDKFWSKLKRDLYALPFAVEYNDASKTLFFEFKTTTALEQKINAIKAISTFDISYNPEGFKYKVKTTIISRKTHLDILRNKIEKLGGVDFEIIIPKQNEETGDWVIPISKRPKKLFIGRLSRKESNISTLIFTLNTYYKEHQKALGKLLPLLEEKAPIKQVYPNLIGDAVKIGWLRQAVEKLTNPTDKADGKPVNLKLKDFIFDSSKAEPIYEELKITEGSPFWRAVERSKLSKLNNSQIKAVLSAIYATDLCLLQGPPGTGKTTVISEIIWQQIRNNANTPNGFKILLTSETNLAVDNALEKLIGENTTIVKPLRFGKSIKFEEEGKRYSIDRIMEWADGSYHIESNYENELLEIDENELEEAPENLSNNAVQRWMLSIGNRAQKRANPKYSAILKDWHKDLALPTTEIKALFRDKYFKYANVIGSTCSSCGSPRFKRDYDKLFNAGFNGKAAREVIYLMDAYPNSRKIWKLLDEELRINTDDISKSDFPTIKQTLIHKLNISFDAVIMDEASKATPPEMILPLCFGKKSIIIGDHKQLPPMINDREFKEVLLEETGDEKLANEIGQNYLKQSQFKRLIVNPKVSSTIRATFDVQYRMHSQIGNLIQQFYPELENGLVCGIKEQEDIEDLDNKASRHHGFSHEGFIDPRTHVIWVDVPEPETKDGTSRINEKECETVKQVLNYLKNAEGFEAFQNYWEKEKDDDKRLQEQEIGIISFYGKQIRKLNEVRKYGQKELGMKIRLKTVDKFQGMERNIIIVSTVRSDSIIDVATGNTVPNIKGREGGRYSPWGFAESPERLNVALSRARRLLIIVGNIMHFAKFRNKEGEAIYQHVINQIPPRNIIDYKMLNKYQ